MLAVVYGFYADVWEKAEMVFYNWRLAKTFTPSPKEAPIAAIGITGNFESVMGEPFSRKFYADLLEILAKEKARVVGFDIFFPAITDAKTDRKFINSIRKTAKTVLPVFSPVKLGEREGIFYKVPEVRSSNVEFNSAATSLGHINVFPDNDQVVRRVPAFIQRGEKRYPQLSLEMARLYHEKDRINFVISPKKPTAFSQAVPISRDGTIYVRMLPDEEMSKYVFAFEDILSGKYRKGIFQNRAVIVGQTVVGAKNADLVPTPMGTKFGVFFQAAFLHNAVTGNYIYRLDKKTVTGALFLWSILMGLALFSPVASLNTFLLLVSGTAITGFSLYSMRKFGLFFDGVPFFALTFLCYLTSLLYSLFSALKKLFQKENAFKVLNDVEKEITRILSPSEMTDNAQGIDFSNFEGEALIKQTPEIALKTILNSVGIEYGAIILASSFKKYKVIAEEGNLTSAKEVEKLINRALESKEPLIMNRIPASSGLKAYKIRNLIAVPVIYHPTLKVLGLFINKQAVPFSKNTFFSKDDLPVISSLTLQSLIAIQNAQLNITLKDTQLESIFRLSVAIEYRDRETGMHIHRVSEYAGIIAENIGLRKNEIELIKNAMPLHDIGKIAIPDKVLLKPGRLTGEEREVVKQHPVLGAKILEGSKSLILKVSEIIALYHHEKYDGTGYPFGLKGNSIPLYGRIAAIADIFDALSSKRVYKEAMGFEKSKALLLEESGTTFDPRLVKAFMESEKSILRIIQTYRESEEESLRGAKYA